MISPQTKVVLAGEGMPAQHTGNLLCDAKEQLQPLVNKKKGNLIVRYQISFPPKILSHHKQQILEALA